MNWRRHFLWVALLVASGTSHSAVAETGPFRDVEVKAAFLFNFAQFIEWPAQSFSNAAGPFVIGVLGDDAFGHILNQLVQGETIRGRSIVLKSRKRAEELTGCHILFISRTEQARLAKILSTPENAGVLTVGESAQFTRLGGIINFITTRDNKVRFELHLANATRAGLKIDAKLLKVAQVVSPAHPGENP